LRSRSHPSYVFKDVVYHAPIESKTFIALVFPELQGALDFFIPVRIRSREVPVSDYEEILDPKEIRHLNRVLSAKLKQALGKAETRTIGYPRGTFRASVRFHKRTGNGVLFWTSRLSRNRRRAINLFGRGAPGDRATLNIEVQFNIPIVSFSRQSGGTFLRHLPTGRIVLAHRGIATLGHSRIKKNELFSKMASTVREVNSGGGTNEYLLIGELESPTLISDIDTFSSELRRTVKEIGALNHGSRSGDETRAARSSSKLAGRLRKYFDEFSGKRTIESRKSSVADCYHGTIVRALRDAFQGKGEILKNQEIDLTVVMTKRILLFEAKTSSHTQSVYTAIGQLSTHAPAVKRYAPKRPVVKVIVLPEQPVQRLCKILEAELEIRFLIFTRSAKGDIEIRGLKGLR